MRVALPGFSYYLLILKKDLNTCSDPGTCINTPGGFRCEKRNIDIVWLVDGTGSYKGYVETAKQAFKDQVNYLINLSSEEKYAEFSFRMGLTFFADRLFKQNEMQTDTNRVYSSAIALTEVDDYVFNSAFDAAFASIPKMYGGGDAPEDPLLGIIFTMTDPFVDWAEDSIKQVHIFTDIDYHYDAFSSRHPPMAKWVNQERMLNLFLFLKL